MWKIIKLMQNDNFNKSIKKCSRENCDGEVGPNRMNINMITSRLFVKSNIHCSKCDYKPENLDEYNALENYIEDNPKKN